MVSCAATSNSKGHNSSIMIFSASQTLENNKHTNTQMFHAGAVLSSAFSADLEKHDTTRTLRETQGRWRTELDFANPSMKPTMTVTFVPFGVIKHGELKNTLFISIETPILSGFPIATVDCRRIIEGLLWHITLLLGSAFPVSGL